MSMPPEIKEYDKRIEEVHKEEEAAIDGQDIEGAASLRDKEQTLQDERNQKEQDWRDEAAHGIASLVLFGCVRDRKSTRLNSSHVSISYAVFCLKKKSKNMSKLATNEKPSQAYG